VRLPTSRRTRRAERARAEADERFRRAFEDSGVGMALVAADPAQAGRILEANGALAELTGYPSDELSAMDLDAIVHPDDLAALADGIHKLSNRESTSFHAEHRVLTAAGMVRWVNLSISLVCGLDGEPLHRLVQVQDISERKRFEGQLQYLADHDPLTGLFNRRRFEHELERELESSRRY
jgi:PAS domain S-box-containing protein